MTKKGIISLFVTLMLLMYLVFGVAYANREASLATCPHVSISVADNALTPFVKAQDIDVELGGLTKRYTGAQASLIPLQAIEDSLNAMRNVERANVCLLSDNTLQVDIVPMVPVLRVFEPDGSYYINREGKHLSADLRYRIDVPVVMREKGAPDPVNLVDLMEEIEANPTWRQLVTAVNYNAKGDVIIIPSVAGHVVNFGAPRAAADKFRRLFAFYKDVLSVRGWQAYDTISVKFAGQVIGKYPHGSRAPGDKPEPFEEQIEEIDIRSLGALETQETNPQDVKPRI